ncbi:MAG TPA: alpha-glucosidase C-terminal domain-containing protein [Polyangiaceae bacterium]|nr:alpha-glucosidase C-terminal domain-containing protein [Polyangiaceae bacterium]
MSSSNLRNDPLWFKDAILCKVYVRGVFDSNADGMGGLRELACTRSWQGATILCLHRLARFVQPVELDLRQFAGIFPVEMPGGAILPQIAERPVQLALGPHGFCWFCVLRNR